MRVGVGGAGRLRGRGGALLNTDPGGGAASGTGDQGLGH